MGRSWMGAPRPRIHNDVALLPPVILERDGKKHGVPQVAIAMFPEQLVNQIATAVVNALLQPCGYTRPGGFAPCGMARGTHTTFDHPFTTAITLDVQGNDEPLENTIGFQHG